MKHLRTLLALLLLGLACFQVGCNTTKGAGRDIENAGEEVQHAADKAADAVK